LEINENIRGKLINLFLIGSAIFFVIGLIGMFYSPNNGSTIYDIIFYLILISTPLGFAIYLETKHETKKKTSSL